MPAPWWHRVIDPEALRAATIILFAFVAAYCIRRDCRFTWHRWRGVYVDRCVGPWPVHLVVGFLTVDVMG